MASQMDVTWDTQKALDWTMLETFQPAAVKGFKDSPAGMTKSGGGENKPIRNLEYLLTELMSSLRVLWGGKFPRSFLSLVHPQNVL